MLYLCWHMVLMYAAGIVGGYLNKLNAEVAEWRK